MKGIMHDTLSDHHSRKRDVLWTLLADAWNEVVSICSFSNRVRPETKKIRVLSL
jgi:hypothetical protein